MPPTHTHKVVYKFVPQVDCCFGVCFVDFLGSQSPKEQQKRLTSTHTHPFCECFPCINVTRQTEWECIFWHTWDIVTLYLTNHCEWQRQKERRGRGIRMNAMNTLQVQWTFSELFDFQSRCMHTYSYTIHSLYEWVQVCVKVLCCAWKCMLIGFWYWVR